MTFLEVFLASTFAVFLGWQVCELLAAIADLREQRRQRERRIERERMAELRIKHAK